VNQPSAGGNPSKSGRVAGCAGCPHHPNPLSGSPSRFAPRCHRPPAASPVWFAAGGRIARDPESRTTQGGTQIGSLSVVTDRPARNKEGKTYKDDNGYTVKDSEFHRVTCFNGLAQNVARFCSKGQLVTIEGRIHYTSWDDKDGVKRYGCEILADRIEFLSKARSGRNEDAPPIDEE
jgi:single-strand DNA-binding protein